LTEITASLEDSYRSYVEYAPAFWDPNATISIEAVFSPISNRDFAGRVWKGQWAKIAAAIAASGDSTKRYSLALIFTSDTTHKEVWEQQQPIDPAPLAEESRKLVPDKTFRTHFDVESVTHFQVPAARIPPGAYRVTLAFVAPDGSRHRFPDASDFSTAPYLVIRPTPLNRDHLLLPSHVTDAPDLLTRATVITNPGRRQFPKDDPNDCEARSIWTLTTFQNRVFVGYGDWDKNRGPIDLWSFAPEGSDPTAPQRYRGRYAFLAGENPKLLFTHEYTVQEESIDSFRVCGDRLFLPGIDGNKEFGPDGEVFGSVYIREKGFWRKLSGLAGANHVTDVAENGRRLYAETMPRGLMVSDDDGIRSLMKKSEALSTDG
jgi:hypothetical protein